MEMMQQTGFTQSPHRIQQAETLIVKQLDQLR
jgi:hypothetical protein